MEHASRPGSACRAGAPWPSMWGLDSGDPSETFALLLRGRAEILKRSSLIKRNSADFGVIGGLSAVITVITVTFAIER